MKEEDEEAEKEKVNGIFYRISESFSHVLTNVNNIDLENRYETARHLKGAKCIRPQGWLSSGWQQCILLR